MKRVTVGNVVRAAVLCAAVAGSRGLAATNAWTNPGDGVWSVGTNWSLGVPPAAADLVYLTNSGAADLKVTYQSAANPTLLRLQLDRTGGGMLVVTQNQDGLTASQSFAMGTIPGSRATFFQNHTVTNVLGIWGSTRGFTLGPWDKNAPIAFGSATATYHLVSGHLSMSGALGGGNICGGVGINGAVGHFIQDGGRATYSSVNSRQLLIGGLRNVNNYYIYGRAGVGSYTLNDGYTLFILEIGAIEGGKGTFIQNGGTNASTVNIGFFGNGSYQFNGGSMNNIYVGGNGGTGVWTQTGGVIGNAASSYFYVSVGHGKTNLNGGAGLGIMNMEGGTNRPYYSFFRIGSTGRGILNQSGGRLDKTYQSPSDSYITAIGFTNGAYGTFNLSGGDFLAINLYVGNSQGATGEVNQTGGIMSFGNPAQAAGHLVIGRRGAGAFNLGGTNTTGIITNVGSLSPSMTVRQNPSASGEVRGWGKVQLKGTCVNNGRITADGYGTDRALDLSRFTWVSNTIENAASETYGWYAQNRGELVLPPLTVTAGTQAYNWGESAGDNDIDLVGSMRLAFTNVTVGGAVSVSLLAPDRPEFPEVPDRDKILGVWRVRPPALAFDTLSLTLRYDDARRVAAGVEESSLTLYRATGSKWAVIPAAVDVARRQMSATVTTLAADTYLAVGYMPPKGTVIYVR